MTDMTQHNTARNWHVLIAEDEPAHAEAIQRALADAGWTDTEVVDTLQAFRARSAAAPPDIALLDLLLPDGRSTALLTAPAEGNSFPIIVMTSHGDEQTVVEVLRAGAFDYLVKSPESFNDLPRTLARVQREWSLVRERKHALTALRESEARYRAVTEGSPNGIFMARLDGDLVYVNPALAEQFGVPPAQLLGSGWEIFIHPLDRQKTIAAWTHYLAGHVASLDIECRVVRQDGAERSIHVGANPIRDKDQIISHAGTTRDVTERNSLQKQLVQSQKMEAVGQLTGGIAHDFNNILASMLGYTDLALELYVPDKQSKLASFLAEVMQAGERARNLISKMLEFSRGTNGETQPVAAGQMVLEVVQLLKSAFPTRIEFATHIAADVPLVSIDPVHLHQILMNLCINARDALTSRGRIEIALCRRPAVAAICSSCHHPIKGEFVEISVRDNGTGMDPHTLLHMFEPFFTTKQIGKGSGMGLATVHGLVHSSGGHLNVESTPAVGTTLRIWLPLASATDTPATPPAVAKQSITPNDGQLIMVVDDEPSVANLMGELLRSQGYRADVFHDSLAALAEFRANPTRYAALLTDYTMPGIDGLELAQSILKERPEFPTILCSGYSDQMDTIKNGYGIRAFFAKPVKAVQLLSALDTIFAKHLPVEQT